MSVILLATSSVVPRYIVDASETLKPFSIGFFSDDTLVVATRSLRTLPAP